MKKLISLQAVNAAFLAAGLSFPAFAFADDFGDVTSRALNASPDASVTQAIPAASAEPSKDIELSGFSQTLTDDQLAQQSGGADLHVSENNLSATVGQNTATNVTTGNNTIKDNAFTNASGLPMAIQNSGNNVVIQNSTILNLQLK